MLGVEARETKRVGRRCDVTDLNGVKAEKVYETKIRIFMTHTYLRKKLKEKRLICQRTR